MALRFAGAIFVSGCLFQIHYIQSVQFVFDQNMEFVFCAIPDCSAWRFWA
jgi:hypothetical protein